MPEFSHPFSGLANERTVTKSELVRTIRYSIAAEYEAIQLYEQLAESTDHTLAAKVLRDIANEEKEHVGEFQRLLEELAPEESGYYADGRQEVEEMMEELKNGS